MYYWISWHLSVSHTIPLNLFMSTSRKYPLKCLWSHCNIETLQANLNNPQCSFSASVNVTFTVCTVCCICFVVALTESKSGTSSRLISMGISDTAVGLKILDLIFILYLTVLMLAQILAQPPNKHLWCTQIQPEGWPLCNLCMSQSVTGWSWVGILKLLPSAYKLTTHTHFSSYPTHITCSNITRPAQTCHAIDIVTSNWIKDLP